MSEVKELEWNVRSLQDSLRALATIDHVMAPRCAELIDLLDDFLEKWKAPEEEAD